MSYSFEQIAALQPGDTFYECGAGMNIKCVVKTTPEMTKTEEPRRQLRWVATEPSTGKDIDYLVTEGLMHYGPRIYGQPQYGGFKNGEFVTPIRGEA